PVASLAPKIDQSVYMVGREQKQALLHHLIGEHNITRTLVFTRTKHGADKVTKKLNHAGIKADSIHGNKSQNQRQRALDGFRAGKSHVLVATDVAARGLDIDDITHVFNYDLPHEPEAYVHRIGRTGRAGATGEAIAFCDRSERSLLRQIERLTGSKINATTDLPDLPKPEPKPKSDSKPESNNGEAHASYADRATAKPRSAKHRSGAGDRYNPNKSRNQNSRKPAGRGRSHPRSR
ncbi:ATP-dependent RNA helicase RhlE, partial [hydrothermal vent metagenome]